MRSECLSRLSARGAKAGSLSPCHHLSSSVACACHPRHTAVAIRNQSVCRVCTITVSGSTASSSTYRVDLLPPSAQSSLRHRADEAETKEVTLHVLLLRMPRRDDPALFFEEAWVVRSYVVRGNSEAKVGENYSWNRMLVDGC